MKNFLLPMILSTLLGITPCFADNSSGAATAAPGLVSGWINTARTIFGFPVSATPSFEDPLAEALRAYRARREATLSNLNMIPASLIPCDRSFEALGRREISLSEFFEQCPTIANEISWKTGVGVDTPYPLWDAAKKERLNDFFVGLLDNQEDLGIRCPNVRDGVRFRQAKIRFTAQEAFETYAASVAHVLYVEALRQVPWSILSMTSIQRQMMLRSENYYSTLAYSSSDPYRYVMQGQLQDIQAGRDYQETFEHFNVRPLICDPRTAYRFLSGEYASNHRSLLGATAEETLAQISYFFYKNLAHGNGLGTSQYEVENYSFLDGRLRGRTFFPKALNAMLLAEAGCHGAAALMEQLARGVNIPLLNVTRLTSDVDPSHFPDPTQLPHLATISHRAMIYRWDEPEALFLEHVDNLYSAHNYHFFMPIDAAGRSIPENSLEAVERFFVSTWETPREIRRWGFAYQDPPSLVRVGEAPLGVFTALQWEDLPDFGHYAGHWQRTHAAPDDYSALTEVYTLQQKYELCGWAFFIENYCDRSIQEFLHDIQTRSSLNLYTGPRPPMHTPQEFYNRAQACVNAYGGCEQVDTLLNEWVRDAGNHEWAEPRRLGPRINDAKRRLP